MKNPTILNQREETIPKKNEKLCTFLREKILKVPEKKYKLKNTRENLKKSAREATREKIEKNPFLGHFFSGKKNTAYLGTNRFQQ